jgi:hypothetical protein
MPYSGALPPLCSTDGGGSRDLPLGPRSRWNTRIASALIIAFESLGGTHAGSGFPLVRRQRVSGHLWRLRTIRPKLRCAGSRQASHEQVQWAAAVERSAYLSLSRALALRQAIVTIRVAKTPAQVIWSQTHPTPWRR